MPWAVLGTRTAAPSYIGTAPVAVSTTGDLYTVNTLAINIIPTKIFGDTFYGSGVASKSGVTSSFSVELGGIYFTSVLSLDTTGNLLIGGEAHTSGVPITNGAYRSTAPGDHAPFVCKLSASDGTPLFCTYLDSTQMTLKAIATDSTMNVYILAKASPGSITPTAGAFSSGAQQIVLMKLDPTGSSMKFMAAFGGTRGEAGQFLAVDASGNAYIAGTTESSDFPDTAGSAFPIFPPESTSSSFLAKLDPAGANILWASYGRADEIPTALAVDSSGQVYLAGNFVRKFAADGSAVLWEKNFAAAGAAAIGIDSLGIVTLVGGTQSANFPIYNSTATCPLQRTPYPGGSVLIRLTPDGALLQSTFLNAAAGILSLALSPTSPADTSPRPIRRMCRRLSRSAPMSRAILPLRWVV